MRAERLEGHSDCRVAKTLRAGQPGTVKLARRYGSALVCVRYRQTGDGRIRYTTIELVVEEAPIQQRMRQDSIVSVRIDWGEASLSARAKALGASWHKASRLWRMTLRAARALGLEHRITACP